MVEVNEIRKVKLDYVNQLFSLSNVVSVGIGKKRSEGQELDDLSLVVGVKKKLPLIQLKKEDIVPKTLSSIKTDVIEVGEVKPLYNCNRTSRIRPAKGGHSIGNVDITAGTLGCLVYRGKEAFILSNAHVLVADPSVSGSTPIEIIQPGDYDNGQFPSDHIANLTHYEQICCFFNISICPVSNGITSLLNGIAKVFGRQSRFHAFAQTDCVNFVDAAIAKPLQRNLVDNEVEDIGIPSGIYSGSSLLDKKVIKSGRTTCVTKGTIKQIDLTIEIAYDTFLGIIPTKIARFKEQIMIESPDGGPRFSDGGDSGSVVFVDDDSNKVCGLLFAGDTDGTFTYANSINWVLKYLGVQIRPS